MPTRVSTPVRTRLQVPFGRARALVAGGTLVVAVVVASAVLAIVGMGTVAGDRPPAGDGSQTQVGRVAPELRGTSLAGTPLDLAALRGSVVVVDVWAAWCAPCRDELPLLAEAQRRLGPAGLRVVGIDVQDGAVQARQLLAGAGADSASSVADPSGALAAAWDVRDLPQTFVVDRSGMLRARHLGAVTAAWLDGAVSPLLADRGTAG